MYIFVFPNPVFIHIIHVDVNQGLSYAHIAAQTEQNSKQCILCCKSRKPLFYE